MGAASDQSRVGIHGLPVVKDGQYEALAERLKKQLSRVVEDGLIRELTIVDFEMPKGADGASQGFAFIDFSDVEEAMAGARKANGYKLDRSHTLNAALLTTMSEATAWEAEGREADAQRALDAALVLGCEEDDESFAKLRAAVAEAQAVGLTEALGPALEKLRAAQAAAAKRAAQRAETYATEKRTWAIGVQKEQGIKDGRGGCTACAGIKYREIDSLFHGSTKHCEVCCRILERVVPR